MNEQLQVVDKMSLTLECGQTFAGFLYEGEDFFLLTFVLDGDLKKAKVFKTARELARLIAWREWISYLRAIGFQTPQLQSDGYVQTL